MNHPNVVKVIDVGIIDDQPYMAMELLPLGSLEARLRATDVLSVSKMGSLLEALAGALDYAHKEGVLHRDIKPSN